MRRVGLVAGSAGAAVAVVAAAWLWWPDPDQAPERSPSAGRGNAAAKGALPAVQTADNDRSAGATVVTPRDADRAETLTPEEREALRAELAGRPDAEAEFQRIVDYLIFSRQWEAFQRARAQGEDPAGLRATATALDAALPARWQQGELTGPQALQLKSQLLEVLLSSDAERQTVLKSWKEALAPAGGPSAAERRFLEAQAALLAAYGAQAPAQRQPAALTAQLEALREQHFRGSTKP